MKILIAVMVLMSTCVCYAQDVVTVSEGVYSCVPELVDNTFIEWEKYKFDREIDARIEIERIRHQSIINARRIA